MKVHNPANQADKWRFGAVAGAVALAASIVALPAYAVSLGRLSVLSALGEPLRAEIDVAQITPEEAASLKAAVATPEAFKAAGLEFTPVLADLQVTLQRRADGGSYLRLSSSRPVNEPFVDLVLQATWASGRLTRDYTMLFDPPSSRSTATAVSPTAPVLSRPARPAPTTALNNEQSPRMPQAAREERNAPSASGTQPAPAVKPPASRVTSAENSAGVDKQLTVRRGDTAGKLASENQPASVSLDQMLVAMLRSNPSAFIDGNINRIKAGAVLDMPGTDAAGAISPREASQIVIAQSKDFNTFRRKLAEGVATTASEPADRQAGGKVQAKVEDRAPATATPDKLTLSKGSVQTKSGTATAEDAIAKGRQSSEASARVAELSKNISDLNKLGVGPGPAAASAAPSASASASPAPALSVPTPPMVATPSLPSTTTPSPTASASAPASTATASPSAASSAPAEAIAAPPATPASSASPTASASASVASQPAERAAATASAAVASKPAASPVTAPGTSFLDDLLENPFVLPLAGGLLALLAGLGIYSYRKRKGSVTEDSSFLESRLQPDSFFGASGGQRIDTDEVTASGSSLVYSPSQLDAAGDVDPVAEADVYLAYGRDLQAEEILKEALRTTPKRVAIHAKLAEIYAKRRDAKAFETIALEAFNLTQGKGPEWAYVSQAGRELDAGNPLYQPGGMPAEDPVPATPAPASASAGMASIAAGNSAAGTGISFVSATPTPYASPASKPDLDFDLDLDFPLGDLQDGHTSPAPISALLTPEPSRTALLDKLDMDFSEVSSQPIALTYPLPLSRGTDAGFPSNGAGTGTVKTAPAAAILPDSGMLEFDLDSLSLDLNGPTTQREGDSANPDEDPLQTKFLLAEEFRSLGDPEGARALAEEVLAEARGPLKVKAQAFLNSLA